MMRQPAPQLKSQPWDSQIFEIQNSQRLGFLTDFNGIGFLTDFGEIGFLTDSV